MNQVVRRVADQTVMPVADRKRFVLAFVAAACSDVVSVFAEFVPPVQIAVDVGTALVLWALWAGAG